jgi:hypothetical protein
VRYVRTDERGAAAGVEQEVKRAVATKRERDDDILFGRRRCAFELPHWQSRRVHWPPHYSFPLPFECQAIDELLLLKAVPVRNS